ncbi:hypothetical protein [Prevotella intermedia]|uniref:Fimbrillin family protein n=1 Tax=Prevotella intermedia TaxID=28131 RepID=A0A2D3L3Z9_PREIN|nr:hypothetical protein [Prevotella intermedia]ATV25298.1 hypothetical protein CTM62_00160 [Prevotella intermedia]
MRKIHFCTRTFALIALALIIASCANDETEQENAAKKLDAKGMTEFAVVDDETNAKALSTTRTSGEYTGSSIKFYWTSNDRLWINNSAATPPIKGSKRSDIPTSGGKVTAAKFYFDGIYSAATYPVRYTGNGNSSGEKVTIKATQVQQTPNDGAHIGVDGDCGTAVATRQSDGSYRFMLDHKASYLTFIPYYSIGFTTDVKVTQIKVKADQAVAGTYDFDDTGIKLVNATSTSQSVTLTFNGGNTNGFEIPNVQNYAKNAAIMVIAPGSYTNFTVEYTLYDQITKVTGTVCKNYGNVTCAVGKNKKVAADLAIINRGNKLYMWDALKDYWWGYENEQPVLNGVTNPHFPKNKASDPQRWYYDVNAPTGEAVGAGGYAFKCPNVNEMLWYICKGNPHWDGEKLFSFAKHLYKGGMWFKKKSVIMSENNLNSATMRDKFNGTDYRPVGTGWARINNNIASGSPSNINNYFFLPAINFFWQGSFYGSGKMGEYGDYWTSSASNQNNSNENAFNLAFGSNTAGVYNSLREKGAMTIAFE